MSTKSRMSTKYVPLEVSCLYIPHVFSNIGKTVIENTLSKLFLANTKSIIFVPKIGKDNQPYNSVFIRISDWHDTVAAKHFQESLRNPKKETRLMYDDPWYWIVLETTSTKTKSKSKTHKKAKKAKHVKVVEPVKQVEEREYVSEYAALFNPYSDEYLDDPFEDWTYPEDEEDVSAAFTALNNLETKMGLRLKMEEKLEKEFKKEEERLKLKEERFQEFESTYDDDEDTYANITRENLLREQEWVQYSEKYTNFKQTEISNYIQFLEADNESIRQENIELKAEIEELKSSKQ
jgi:hypothetical protein